jgi:hypothetical protein
MFTLAALIAVPVLAVIAFLAIGEIFGKKNQWS